MRVAVLTSGGPFGTLALDAMHHSHDVAVVVRPATRTNLKARVKRFMQKGRLDGVRAWCAAHDVPEKVVAAPTDPHLAAALKESRCDVCCILSFPWILPDSTLAVPPAGVLNVHPSLLPRHRGAQPLPWHYLRNDREAGVTVHRAVARVDAGPIAGQATCPLPRGYDIEALYLDTARRAAPLLADTLTQLESGSVEWHEQDTTGVTSAPIVRSGTALVEWTEWDVERVWHTLAGLASRFHEPLVDSAGKPVPYRNVPAFNRCEPPGKPGTVRTLARGEWKVACLDGEVTLLRDPGDKRS